MADPIPEDIDLTPPRQTEDELERYLIQNFDRIKVMLRDLEDRVTALETPST